MPMPHPKQPISWRQLCLIVKEQLLADPTMWHSSDWSEAVKRRLVQLHFHYPPPRMLTAAMEAVEASGHTLAPSPSPPRRARSVDPTRAYTTRRARRVVMTDVEIAGTHYRLPVTPPASRWESVRSILARCSTTCAPPCVSPSREDPRDGPSEAAARRLADRDAPPRRPRVAEPVDR
jgi:hypothetical protein